MTGDVDLNLIPMDASLCVSFEPQAIRDHFEADEPDPTEGLTDEQLKKIGYWAIAADTLWAEFHRLLVEAVEAYKNGEIT